MGHVALPGTRQGREAAQEAERLCIARMLVQTHGNRRRAAINLGVCDRV